MCNTTDRTYVEDVKKPDEVQPPSGNLVPITLRKNEPGDRVSFPLFHNLGLNFRHGSVVEKSISGPVRCMHYWSGSRSKISNRIENRLVEFIQSSPLQSSVEYLAYITASLSKLDVVPIVGHRVLDKRESGDRLGRVRGNVLGS
jgi:hypothetical protein